MENIALHCQPAIDGRTPRHRLAQSHQCRHQIEQPSIHQCPLAVPRCHPPKLLTAPQIGSPPNDASRAGQDRTSAAPSGCHGTVSPPQSPAPAAATACHWCGSCLFPGVSAKPASCPPLSTIATTLVVKPPLLTPMAWAARLSSSVVRASPLGAPVPC